MATRLEAQAMELSPEERVKLADRPIASVFRDHDVEEACPSKSSAAWRRSRPDASS